MKVTVMGGGSTYTPELVNGFLARVAQFPVTELWLMDIDEARLNIVGGFARRMVEAKGSPFKVVLSTDRRAAVAGASYVTTQLRVGQMPARREDEYLGMRYGLVGQETTGVGGMAKALRTVPVILQIAADMRELAAPGALLVNFTNPAGLVTQALSMFAPDVPAVGVCNVPITAKMYLLELYERATGLKVDADSADLETLGLNHLSWHRSLRVDDHNVWPEVIKEVVKELRAEDEPEFDPTLVETLGVIPNYYLGYYYDTAHKIELQAAWPPSRADTVIEVEKVLLQEYADPNLKEAPADMMKRGGAYYSTVATQLLNAHYNDLGEVQICNMVQGGAVPGYPKEWVMELPCRVNKAGITPLPADPLPLSCFGLLSQVKTYELLTARAAATCDRALAYEALVAHPLGPGPRRAMALLEEMLEINRPYLPAKWFGGEV